MIPGAAAEIAECNIAAARGFGTAVLAADVAAAGWDCDLDLAFGAELRASPAAEALFAEADVRHEKLRR